ncbi:hypothetical protein JAAARDRAFT_199735 [Jaapia argillacea MUCL 33604]|uniref:Spt20-like SEP domain-containing protein n=1 Tax=Jaapia argillacea MUCL 33604 TaxID=933084 RepID=A0A067PI94_9AGAM|nr:hypothetical protein JAAARDRAFT_199735 [Jaapia argillacea MUCL 33604]
MAGYNLTRSVQELLEKNESSQPSFTVHLYPEHWTLNNGSKFLYNNQVASLLDDIRAQRIPVDFLELFDSARVPFYEGCLIVELLDYRPPKLKEPALEKPDRTRVVLHPNTETLWADICLLNQKFGGKWTDQDALEIEARLLLATAPPICLDPDPHLVRVANSVLKVSSPTVPASLKRKSSVMEPEEDETDIARRAKMSQYMNPRNNRPVTPSYRLLDFIQKHRSSRVTTPPSTAAPTAAPSPLGPRPSMPHPPPINTAVQNNIPAKVRTKKKGESGQMSPVSTASTSATPTPVGPGPNATYSPHQLPPQNAAGRPPSVPPAWSPMPNSTYAAGQGPSEPGKVAPSPVPPSSQQPPRPSSQPQQPLPPGPYPPNPQQPPHTFQAPIPHAQFLAQPPPGKNKAATKSANGGTPSMPTQALPQGQPNPAAQTPQMQQYYAQHYAAHHRYPNQVQAPQPNGRATPQATPAARSPMPQNQNAAQAARSSPTNAAPQQPPPAPQMSHPPQHNPYAMVQNQHIAPHLRPMGPGAPHPGVPHHMMPGANPASHPTGSPAQQGQHPQPLTEQQQRQHNAQMMHYMNMNYMNTYNIQPGQIPQPYWMGMGRGIPSVNGQHQMPGMTPNQGHAPQMPLGLGKAVQGGLQGR